MKNIFQVGDLLQRQATSHLGMTIEEFEKLKEQSLDQEGLITLLEEKAVQKNVPIEIREQVSTLKSDLEGASMAHKNWQPADVSNKARLSQERM